MFCKAIYSQVVWQIVLVAAALFSGPRLAAAQARYEPKPLSNVGGHSSESLNQIYRDAVGQGYSGSSLNTLSLQYFRNTVPYSGQSTTRSSSAPRINLGTGGGNSNKPFSTVYSPPTVSPYSNLFREDLSGNDSNYTTLVRPQLQQQQFNQQVQRAATDLNRKLDTMSAQADFNPQGDRTEYPTGHQTVFRYFGRYYQMPASGKGRR